MKIDQLKDLGVQINKITSYARALDRMAEGLRLHPLPGRFGGATFYVATETHDPETGEWGTIDEATMAERVRAMKAIGGTVHKEMTDDAASYWVRFEVEHMSEYAWPRIMLSVARETVCERKVVGTERKTVTKYVPVQVEEDVDIVEWDCHPILGQVDA